MENADQSFSIQFDEHGPSSAALVNLSTMLSSTVLPEVIEADNTCSGISFVHVLSAPIPSASLCAMTACPFSSWPPSRSWGVWCDAWYSTIAQTQGRFLGGAQIAGEPSHPLTRSVGTPVNVKGVTARTVVVDNVVLAVKETLPSLKLFAGKHQEIVCARLRSVLKT